MTRTRLSWSLLACTGVLAAGGLLLLPEDLVQPLRQTARDLARPGQELARLTGTLARWSFDWAQGWLGRQQEITRLKQELARLEQDRAKLRQRLNASLERPASVSSTVPLFQARLLPARVLGEEINAVWQGRKFLARGQSQGSEQSLLVLADADENRPVVDLGSDHGLEPEDLVLSGRVVVGRIHEAGHWTSSLQPITDADFRAEAQVCQRTAQGLQPGEIGILSGTGTGCRLKLSREHPVTEGDEIYTRHDDPWLPEPMLFGVVTKVELPPGSLDWDITVEPAAARLHLTSVEIVRPELNPVRQVAN